MMLHHLVYISHAARPFAPAELQRLVAGCVRTNHARGLTGLLLYSHGNFMQLLEGPGLVVDELFEKISLDERHNGVKKLLFKEVTGRLFPKWAMGLLNSEGDTTLDTNRLAEVVNNVQASTKTPLGTETALALLRDFRQQLPARVA